MTTPLPSPTPASSLTAAIGSGPIAVALPCDHPLASRAALDLAALAEAPFLAAPMLARDASRHLEPLAPTAPVLHYGGDDLNTLLELVAAGHGLALVPLAVCARPGIVGVPVREPGLEHRVEVVSLPAGARGRPARRAVAGPTRRRMRRIVPPGGAEGWSSHAYRAHMTATLRPASASLLAAAAVAAVSGVAPGAVAAAGVSSAPAASTVGTRASPATPAARCSPRTTSGTPRSPTCRSTRTPRSGSPRWTPHDRSPPGLRRLRRPGGPLRDPLHRRRPVDPARARPLRLCVAERSRPLPVRARDADRGRSDVERRPPRDHGRPPYLHALRALRRPLHRRPARRPDRARSGTCARTPSGRPAGHRPTPRVCRSSRGCSPRPRSGPAASTTRSG